MLDKDLFYTEIVGYRLQCLFWEPRVQIDKSVLIPMLYTS